jgi:hypothetical protein
VTTDAESISPQANSSAYRASGISPIVETRVSPRQAKPLRFDMLSLDTDCLPSHANQDLLGSELMYQENICGEAIREERTQIAEELDTLLQTFSKRLDATGRGGR